MNVLRFGAGVGDLTLDVQEESVQLLKGMGAVFNTRRGSQRSSAAIFDDGFLLSCIPTVEANPWPLRPRHDDGPALPKEWVSGFS